MNEKRADAVWRQTEQRLHRLISGDDGVVRGRLANLRRGAGRSPGEDPRVWGILFSDLPEEMLGKRGEPSREEWAIHTALTLYALHQQGSDPRQHSMNQKNISLGDAAAQLVGGDEEARDRVARRFHQVVLAPDMATMTYYLRGFVTLLRGADIGLDYAGLARDLYRCQFPENVASIRLQWGQDFYKKGKDDQQNNGKED